MNNCPNFIIGGERRSGSTTLYKILLKHPDISMYPIADMDYFIKPELFSARQWYIDKDIDEEWEQQHSLEEYISLFRDICHKDKVVGQKDADLLFWKKSHKRLKNYLPNTKFIFVLRDPIKRAESQYWNEVAKGREKLSFEQALLKEEERSSLSDYGKLHLNYKQRGKYIDSINHFRKYYDDKQFLIVILEKLKSEPDKQLSKIASFLGISKEEFDLNIVHSNKQEVLDIKKKYKGTFIEDIIKVYDRIIEAFIVRYSKEKDVRSNLRKKLKSFGKESIRKNNLLSNELVDNLKDYYSQSIIELEEYLGYKIEEWK